MINDVTGLMLNHYERSAGCRRIMSVSQKKALHPKINYSSPGTLSASDHGKKLFFF